MKQKDKSSQDLSLRHQAMSNAMMRVANKYQNEEMRKVAKELKQLSQQPKEK